MRVLAGGVFDIIHPGHIFFLRKAAEYGDVIVVVATDETVRKFKKRAPKFKQSQRVEHMKMLKMVSRAVPGKKGDFLDVVREEKPDLIVLGHDQNERFPDLEKSLKSAGLNIKVIRLRESLPGHSTTAILKRTKH